MGRRAGHGPIASEWPLLTRAGAVCIPRDNYVREILPDKGISLDLCIRLYLWMLGQPLLRTSAAAGTRNITASRLVCQPYTWEKGLFYVVIAETRLRLRESAVLVTCCEKLRVCGGEILVEMVFVWTRDWNVRFKVNFFIKRWFSWFWIEGCW